MTVANELKIILTADDRASGGLGKVKGTLTGIGKVAVGAVAGGMAVAGAAIAGAAVKGVTEFIAFEDQMNEVFTLLPGISAGAMNQMSKQVLDFSNEFGRLPNEVVPALYQSLSAGVPQDNVFEFLETAQKAALGGVTDLETAVDGISSVVNAYGADVVSAANASDIMFTAVRLGKTDFNQLSSSLFNVIPTAASLGVSFGDVSASLATLTGQGTPTSVATTQLRAALVEASKGGTKLDKAIQELTGFTFPELIEQGTSMPGVFQALRASMPEQEFKDLFGSVEAVNAVLGITGPNFEKTASAMEQMNSSAGATDAAFETMNTGIARTIERLRANFVTTLIRIGDALSPVVNMIGDKLLGALDAVQPVIEGVVNAIGMFIDDLSAGADPLDAFGSFLLRVASFVLPMSESEFENLGESIFGVIETVRDFISQGREFVSNVFQMLQPVIDAVTNFVSWKDVLMALGVAVAAVVIPAIISIVTSLAPVLLIVGAVIGIIALLRNAWENNWGGIQEKTQIVIEFIRGIIQSALEWIQTFWAENGAQIIATATMIWEQIKTAISTAIEIISQIVTAVLTAIQTFWAAHGEQIMATAAAVWSAIQTGISTAIEIIRSVVTTVLTAIQTFWATHGETILATATTVWNAIQTVISTVIEIIQSIFAAFRSAFEGNWRAFGENLRAAWDRLWAAIKTALATAIPVILNTIARLITGIINKFKSVDWAQLGKDIVRGIGRGLSALKGWLADKAREIARAALDAAKGFLGIDSPSKVFEEVGANVGLGFVEGVLGSRNDVARAFDDLINVPSPRLAADVGLGAFGQFGQPAIAAGAQRTTHNEFHLHVTTTGDPAGLIAEFETLQSMVIE